MNENTQKNSCTFFSGVSVAVSWSSPILQQADLTEQIQLVNIIRCDTEEVKRANSVYGKLTMEGETPKFSKGSVLT